MIKVDRGCSSPHTASRPFSMGARSQVGRRHLWLAATLAALLAAPASLSATGLSVSGAVASGLAAPGSRDSDAINAPFTQERFAIQASSVVLAIEAAHLPEDSVLVKLLANLTSTTANPKLELRGIKPWGDRGAYVRLACLVRTQCLPFYASVQWASPADAQAALHAAGLQGGAHDRALAAAVPEPGFRDRNGSASLTAPSNAARSEATELVIAGNAGQAATMHAGSHATLILDGTRMHIKVAVICLENGSTGHTIRVTALDHKQHYLAEVVDATFLKGSL